VSGWRTFEVFCGVVQAAVTIGCAVTLVTYGWDAGLAMAAIANGGMAYYNFVLAPRVFS
jgi:hypothetical protein